jgi:hypothetical protein
MVAHEASAAMVSRQGAQTQMGSARESGGSSAPPPSPPRRQACPGGSDFDLDRLVALCPPCHAQTDAPYVRGRLIITPLGAGRFTIEVTRGADKWAILTSRRAVDWTCPGLVDTAVKG